VAAFGDLPVRFEPNQGQTSSEVKFLARGAGYTLFLTSTEAVLVLARGRGSAAASGMRVKEWGGAPLTAPERRAPAADSGPAEPVGALRMQVVGAGPQARWLGLEELPGKSNYFIGSDPSLWRTNIPHYARVKASNIYPGIDLVFYGAQGQIEYDFVVAPGWDPGTIRLAFQGADSLSLDAQGNLILQTPVGEVRMHAPRVFQEVDGRPQPIGGGYRLYASPAHSASSALGTRLPARLLGFDVAAYDRSKPLIIDPGLSYSTYLGEWASIDSGYGIAVDAAGNAYVTGQTSSSDFPTTPGAFQAVFGGGFDAFVTKLNPTGSGVVYSTYLGGGYDERGNAIAVDAAGNAHVTGNTNSSNFPTTPGAFQTAFASPGYEDAFLTKLNPTGSALVYSTYLGGDSNDLGYAIAVGAAGNAYVTGITNSSNFPTTPGAPPPGTRTPS
jgi:hypothetical protein